MTIDQEVRLEALRLAHRAEPNQCDGDATVFDSKAVMTRARLFADFVLGKKTDETDS